MAARCLSARLLREGREAAMTEYALGASVSCRDGYCGVVSRTILDPAAGLGIGMGLGHGTPVIVSHAVPVGETEVERHESVHAVDGEIGRVEGFLVSPADNKVTHVLLQEG
jgi:hypothetical protein